MPKFLYYNCDAPHLILGERHVRANIRGRVFRGISMSEWSDMGSHGPFKIAFNKARWFGQFRKIEYGNSPDLKNPMFSDEKEWVTESDVYFQKEDVAYVMLMLNVPCLVTSGKLMRICEALQRSWPDLYREGTVNDPYLSNSNQI